MRSGTLSPMRFEDLTVVYREEKTKGLLSEVRLDLYPSMTALMTSLKSEYDRLLSEDPDSIMCEGANQRRHNAGRLVRDIVSMRMNKISCMALRAACGAQTVIDILTSEERAFYNSVLEAGKNHMGSVNRVTGQVRYKNETLAEPEETSRSVNVSAPVTEAPKSLKDMPVMDDDFDDFGSDRVSEEDFYEHNMEPVEEPIIESEPVRDSVPEPVEEKEEVVSSPERNLNVEDKTHGDDVIFIRILEDLPPFSGPDRDYDLKKEDLVTMPKIMADALIMREKAVLVRTLP